MATDTEKCKIIRGVHFDPENGFGSINETYQQANNIFNSITYANVKDFF